MRHSWCDRARSLLFLFAIGTLSVDGATFAQSANGLKAPDGFEVSLFADDDLARDVFCMTFDSLGRVVVSGPGYVKVLVDSNGDGKADSAKTFADGPKTGAQGMYFVGRDLLCIGDEGLLRFRDRDGDDKADGPPDVFLKMKTGNEHHVHSIQKGPDGWWYIIAGNDAGIDRRYVTLDTSPVKEPQSGVLMRFKPDLSGAEVVTHGLRNAYDFAFTARGDVFTFDSDDEREVSLPWYRPNRVFQLLPGAHAGWVSRQWKLPDYFVDMVPVIAEFGRASPTGVVCYRHTQFPKQYRDSLFVLDWTYGRVLNIQLKRGAGSYDGASSAFLVGTGGFGFAPTDAEVGPDGSLYVSVGGRGTRGGVYRVKASSSAAAKWPSDVASEKGQLAACLDAPQPLSSWSRQVWEPVAKKLGASPFAKVIANPASSEAHRIRSIEIVTELFGGLAPSDVETLASDQSPDVRSRALWSLQRTQPVGKHVELLAKFLNDDDEFVGREAAEALSILQKIESERIVDVLIKRLKSESPFDRMAAARLIPLLTNEGFKNLSVAASKSGFQAGLTNAFGYLGRKPGVNTYAFKIGMLVLEKSTSNDLRLEAIRLMQMGLGDCGAIGKVPAAFESYAAAMDLKAAERELDTYRIALAEIFPTGNSRVDYELARLLAMLQPFNPELLNKVLAKINDESHPTDDLHYLLVAARIPVDREAKHTDQIAKALVDIEPKLRARKLPQDSNWEPRFGELYKLLVEQDPVLPIIMAKRPNFGFPGHVQFMSQLPPEHLSTAIDGFVKQIAASTEYQWTNDVAFIVGESAKPEHRQLVRDQHENFGVRAAVLQVLAAKPEQRDRKLFIEGLESSHVEAVTSSIDALTGLPGTPKEEELVALMKCLRRLGADKAEYAAREKAVALLMKHTGEKLPFEFGASGYRPQPEAVAAWDNWMRKSFPEAMKAADGISGDEQALLADVLKKVDWSKGDADRGRKVFELRSCVQCHSGSKALGPDLAGIAGRFSREDLFTAIVLPNRDVSPRYQTTLIETKDGKTRSGLVIYESVDGLLLRNSSNQTFRIETADIETRRRVPQSLMPSGLLKGLAPQDLADLYSYLQSLR